MSEYENLDTHLEEIEKIGETVAKAYDKGFTDRLRKANTSIVKAFNERYKAINYQHEFGLISDEEYYKKLENARDKYFSRDTQEWHKYTEEIFSYRKAALSEYQSYVEENLESLFKTFDKERANYKEKLLDFSGSATGFDTKKTIVDNYWPNGDSLVMVDYSLTDYEKEIEKLKEFNDAITQLKERASSVSPEVFSAFFDEIKGMSVDDAKILTELLLSASDEDFKGHFNLYEERNKLAENIATNMYADDYNLQLSAIKDDLTKAFGELPTDFFEHGQAVADSFAEGFLAEINGLLSELVIEIPEISTQTENNNVENTTFSPVYYFFGDRASTSRTRINAKDDALYSYMRGGK